MALRDEPGPGPSTPVPGSGCRKRAARKETRRLLREIERAGGEVRPHQGRPGHFKVYVDGEYIGGIAGTPSDRRAFANDIARLRRNGLPITSKGRYET
ncbi:HicA-like toxin [Mycobacterium phage Quesadilla]|uniref:HicA-like toxin n=1 Tax=Mycobacterium phage Quesadilla TaxID=2664226 RepID=A0A5Q2W9X8_9CAUD|nr:HicA-like toxin [Mycobacterium phage Quesadilla]QGH75331.1 HicA-like toxin [Mycobacterium phage Quesadilla]